MTHHAIKSRTSRVYRIMDFCLLISGIPAHWNHLRIPFFSGELLHLRIRILREPGIEGAEETMTASRNASAVLSFLPHPIVFPLRSLRGRCRLRQMRCNYIRAIGATVLQYVSVLPAPKSIAVGNGFIRSVCCGFFRTNRSGNRSKRIGTMYMRL